MYSKHPIVSSAMKTAAAPSMKRLGDFAKKMLTDHPGPSLALAGSALATGASVAYSGYEVLRDAVQKSLAYKDMLAQNPSLRQHKDQAVVKKYFDSMHRMNPHFMNDPLFAGAQVHNVLEAQQSFGGTGQVPMALATAMSELAQGRGKFVGALRDESNSRPNFGRIETVAQHAGQLFNEIRDQPYQKKLDAMKEREKKHDENIKARQERADAMFDSTTKKHDALVEMIKQKLAPANTPSVPVTKRRGGDTYEIGGAGRTYHTADRYDRQRDHGQQHGPRMESAEEYVKRLPRLG